VIGVNLGEDAEWGRRHRIPHRLVLDATGESLGRFGLWAHPNTVLIDRAGRVAGLVRGERPWGSNAARSLIRSLLGPGS
jgi:hypothetical protein